MGLHLQEAWGKIEGTVAVSSGDSVSAQYQLNGTETAAGGMSTGTGILVADMAGTYLIVLNCNTDELGASGWGGWITRILVNATQVGYDGFFEFDSTQAYSGAGGPEDTDPNPYRNGSTHTIVTLAAGDEIEGQAERWPEGNYLDGDLYFTLTAVRVGD